MMKATPITIERTYNSPIDRVWKALTEKEKMKQWYFDLNEFKPQVGFEFTFAGQGHMGEKYIHLCKITEVITGKKLAYSWRYDGYEGNSVVTFELFEEGENKTRLKLTHEGIETFPASKDFALSSFQGGWTELIGSSLKNFVEKE
ncbi:MAG TPA: SRPBCC domain-containing protein [Cyclobacteriaceae bacterium]